jgi:hypothetical protein
MPPRALLTRTCTITPRSGAPTTAPCELQQEFRNAQLFNASQWRLFVPAGTDINATDTVTVDGTDFLVAGDPWEARNPRSRRASHIEVTLVDEALPDEATIRRFTSTPDGGGGFTETWETIGPVAARIDPAVGGGEQSTTGGAIDDRTTHVVTMPAMADIEEPDRVQINGVEYEVTVVRKGGSRELFRRLEVVEAA